MKLWFLDDKAWDRHVAVVRAETMERAIEIGRTVGIFVSPSQIVEWPTEGEEDILYRREDLAPDSRRGERD